MFSIIMYSTAALLIIPAVSLLSGRGAFLIAGYNTASPEKKAAYDEKKLCRVTGGGLLICGILLLLWAVLGEDAPSAFVAAFIIVTLLDVAAMIWLSNTRCWRDGEPPEVTEADRRKSRRITTAAITIAAMIMIPTCVMLFTGNITPEYGEDTVRIRASYWSDLTIRYADITSIEYREEPVPGLRTGGLGSFRLLLGSFRNEEFGSYTRYTYTGCDACVVLTDRGKTIVLSGEDTAATRAIYDALCQRAGLS
ncbi:MAG: DUF3784 domain-containing protein [Ruminococcaceae bacterium]|nr:DUF3784 domain-containing protein [Oscillospiraceae bacterium]